MGEKPGHSSQMRPMPLVLPGSVSPQPITTQSLSGRKSLPKRIGSIFRDWLQRAGGKRLYSEVKLQLDSTPTGVEESRNFTNQSKAMGFPCKEGEAKTRIDSLARRLATGWTLFLMYIVLAQDNGDGAVIRILNRTIQILPRFKLSTPEFVAVFTTTTAAVFGFLVIVANHLFHARKDDS